MLRIIPSGNSAAVRSYYASALRREDYYTAGQEIPGVWHGRGAGYLGLKGEVTSDQFGALVENRDPATGNRLTPRMRADRLCGWDMNFHSVKSLSLLQALTGDQELVRVFREAVVETMADIEGMAATRVRCGGQYEDRLTGNICWSNFVHFTARPVGGIPDPHLHAHAFVQNLTFDSEEGKWKALKIHKMKTEAPFLESLFHSRLSRKVADLGYTIKRTRNGWEIAGLPDEMLGRFSRRTAEIDALAAAKGITDAKRKDALGARTRAGKRKGLGQDELIAAWNSRLHDDERQTISRISARNAFPAGYAAVSASDALAYAEGKCFERASVAKRSAVLTAALRFGVGHLLVGDIEREMQKRGYFDRNVGGDLLCTRASLMIEEAELIARVRKGRATLAPMQEARLRFQRDFLSREQKEAVGHVLKSNDQVIALRGVAGSGKTTLMQEVREQIEATGLRVFAFAPSASASRGVLRQEGFREADTVARLLVDEKIQQQTKGQVIFVDEAGLLGIRDLARIMEIAGEDTRVILCGDTRQHAPIARGDSMRLLENFAGLPIASIRQIRRQEKMGYREAVKALSEGNTEKGFRILEKIGAITEIEDDQLRYRQLAKEYFRCIDQTGAPPLVVSPTHAEARAVTSAIRAELSEQGKLGEARIFPQYRPLQWDEAEKSRPENYEKGLLLQFHQNAAGIKRGSILPVVETDGEKNVWLGLPNGSRVGLDWKTTDRFQVFSKADIEMAKGDLIKITRNGSSLNGMRMFSGTVLKVKEIGKNGELTLDNGVKLSADHGHIDHGYCQTSHSSQGKTVREIFVAQSSSSFLAASKEGFYVGCSRGKENIRIFTDDRIELQRAIGNSSQRMSALELGGIDKEVFMSEGLDGLGWVKRVAAERARHHEPGSHVEKLAASRRIDPMKKPQSVDFRNYIQMRRANVEVDGKSRSKGYGHSGLNTGLKGTTQDKRPEAGKSPQNKVSNDQKKNSEVVTKMKPANQVAGKNAAQPKPRLGAEISKRMETSKQRLKQKLSESLPSKSVKSPERKKVGVGNTKVNANALNGPAAKKIQVDKAVKAQRNHVPQKAASKAPTKSPTVTRK